MYERYGGMMTVTDVSKELGVNRQGAADWLKGRVKGCQVGKRIKFETDQVAKAICNSRDMTMTSMNAAGAKLAKATGTPASHQCVMMIRLM